MNTNPDEAKLALWLEDELHGDELASFETWVLTQPEHLAAREELRRWKKQLAAVIPSEEEPPYPDFFNSRILQAIRDTTEVIPASLPAKTRSWKTWLMPASAFAGMALAFWVGTQAQPSPAPIAFVPDIRRIDFQPVVYTPDGMVNAVWTSGTDASVIILEGVNPIPDATDFSETVYMPTERGIDSTADQQTQPH